MNITLGQIASWIAMIAGIITGVSMILANIKKWLTATLNEKFNGIDMRLDEISERVDRANVDNCKNFLVQVLADIEQGRIIDQVEMQRFWEQYDTYTQHGGNSYIRERVNTFRERGLL